MCAYESTVPLSNTMYYRVGIVSPTSISWSDSQTDPSSGQCVKIALFDKNGKTYVISVYSSWFWQWCYYQINELVGEKKIKFGKCLDFGSGVRPTLAVRSDGTAVVVTETPNSSTLVCHIGMISDDVSKIYWKKSPEMPNISGTTPSVAINNTHIILLYRVSLSSTLKYAHGSLSDEIKWKVCSKDYSSGIRPNVALNSKGVVVIAFMSTMGRKLYFGYGRLDEHVFSPATAEITRLDMGMHPYVSLSNNNKLVEIHRTNFGTSLWISQGGM